MWPEKRERAAFEWRVAVVARPDNLFIYRRIKYSERAPRCTARYYSLLRPVITFILTCRPTKRARRENAEIRRTSGGGGPATADLSTRPRSHPEEYTIVIVFVIVWAPPQCVVVIAVYLLWIKQWLYGSFFFLFIVSLLHN